MNAIAGEAPTYTNPTNTGGLGSTATQPQSAPTQSGWWSTLTSSINPFSGNSFLPNALLIGIGIAMALGALLISQKETVIQVAGTAARVA